MARDRGPPQLVLRPELLNTLNQVVSKLECAEALLETFEDASIWEADNNGKFRVQPSLLREDLNRLIERFKSAAVLVETESPSPQRLHHPIIM